MAEIVKTEKLVASNGSTVCFLKGTGGPSFTTEVMYWPLAEFEDLVKHVREHIAKEAEVDMKLTELEASEETN